MEHTARNFHAHGGAEWVIGGKLTFLPGATVEGAEGLFDLPPGGGAALPYIAESEAATVAALRSDEAVEIEGAESVAKSYPGFFEDLEHIRV